MVLVTGRTLMVFKRWLNKTDVNLKGMDSKWERNWRGRYRQSEEISLIAEEERRRQHTQNRACIAATHGKKELPTSF